MIGRDIAYSIGIKDRAVAARPRVKTVGGKVDMAEPSAVERMYYGKGCISAGIYCGGDDGSDGGCGRQNGTSRDEC